MASSKTPRSKRAQSPFAEIEDGKSRAALPPKPRGRGVASATSRAVSPPKPRGGGVTSATSRAVSPPKPRGRGVASATPTVEPLIPEHKRYTYKPAQGNVAAKDLLAKIFPVEERKKIAATAEAHGEATCRLVHVMCASVALKEQGKLKERGGDKEWRKAFENALANCLPVREHHTAFLTHNMFVTMIGAVVARALEQATCDQAMKTLKLKHKSDPGVQQLTLDLLADRYYVRNIACHDSSKTSDVEATAYSGIMAVHIVKNFLERRTSKSKAGNPFNEQFFKEFENSQKLTEPMANFGFKHHYEKNPHHPEHYAPRADNRMADMHVVEAVVDGLACVFERAKPADAQEWLGKFFVGRFPNQENRDLAAKVISALKSYITPADYSALEAFRGAVHAITGETLPWSLVSMTSCCDHKLPTEPDRYAKTDLSGYFEDNKSLS